MAKNPFYVGPTAAEISPSVRETLRTIVQTHLQAHADRAELPDKTLQDVHPLLSDPKVWQMISEDLGL
jgi:hypothetical protein